MASNVVNGAKCKCMFGSAPSTLVVLPKGKKITGCNQQMATMMDNIPMANIMPFGTCSAPTNPAVVAAMGTPQPCVPVTPAPWMAASTKVMANKIPVITKTSKLQCAYAGTISITSTGQQKVESK